MKARINIDKITGIQEFNIHADIEPKFGAGGINFGNTIKDFESIITANFFKDKRTKIKHKIDSDYLFVTLSSEKNEFEIDIDLLSGKIVSMTLRKGYKGKLFGKFGIGDKMSELIEKVPSIGFDLDHEIYVNYPFDGVLIYPPKDLQQPIFNAVVANKPKPDFTIDSIEILDMDFAKKIYSGTLINS